MSISNRTLYTLEIKSTKFLPIVISVLYILNTIAHEVKHLQSHICQYYNVNEDGEQAAYLMGYLVEKMYNAFKYYL